MLVHFLNHMVVSLGFCAEPYDSTHDIKRFDLHYIRECKLQLDVLYDTR